MVKDDVIIYTGYMKKQPRKDKEKKRDGSNECQKGTFRMKRVKFNKQTNTQNYTTKYNYKMEVSNAHTHAHTCKMYLFYMHAHKTHVETLVNIRTYVLTIWLHDQATPHLPSGGIGST